MIESVVRRVLPRPADRTAAKGLAAVALAPILLLLLVWGWGGDAAAQLTWNLRADTQFFVAEDDPQLWEWYRTSFPLDPWGHSYYVANRRPGNDDPVFSVGPNGVFEGGDGDDVQVAGFFFFGAGFFLIFAAVGGVLSSLSGGFLYFAVRQAYMPRSSGLGVELARAAVIALPVFCCGLCVVFAIDLSAVSERLPFRVVPPGVAAAGTVGVVVYLWALHLRMITKSRSET